MFDLRFPTSLQIVLSVALAERDGFRCTSHMLAAGLNVNLSVIRSLLQPLLEKLVIVETTGKIGGLVLGSPPDRISLCDIYRAATRENAVSTLQQDVSDQSPINAHFDDLFAVISGRAEKAMMEVLAGYNVAVCLETVLSLEQLIESLPIEDYGFTTRLLH